MTALKQLLHTYLGLLFFVLARGRCKNGQGYVQATNATVIASPERTTLKGAKPAKL